MNDNAKRLLRSARDSAVNTHVREDVDKALGLLGDFERNVPFRVRSAIEVCMVTGLIGLEHGEEVVGAVLAALGDPND